MRDIPARSDAGLATLEPCSTVNWLDIDAEVFRTGFDRQPFLIRHHLGEHPLFELPNLLALASRLPARDIEYNAGNIPMSMDPAKTPQNGLSVEETIRRIEECRSWLVMKYVENDPAYRELLHGCLAELKPHTDPIAPGMCLPQGFIFITSPGSVTPYHMDPEHNFLLQVRGSKQVQQFDLSVVTAEQFEQFYGGGHRNMPYKEEFLAKSWSFDLQPGQGLHFPVTFPHWVKNGSEVSISFSITFRTPDLDRRAMLHNANAFLRRCGIRPSPVGASPWRESLKVQTARIWRRLCRLCGLKAP